MKRAKLQQGVSSIVKPGIQTRVRGAIKDLIPGIPDMSKEDRYATIKDIMEPKCYQLTSDPSKLQTSSDYGLSEIKLNVEGGGEEIIFGVPWNTIKGKTLDEKQSALSEMPLDAILQEVKTDGFMIKLKLNQSIIIPGRYAILSIVPGNHSIHGVRQLCFGSETAQNSCKEYVDLSIDTNPRHADGMQGHLSSFLTK